MTYPGHVIVISGPIFFPMSSSSSGNSESTGAPYCEPCARCSFQRGVTPSVPPSTGGGPAVNPATGAPDLSPGSPSWNAFNQSFDASLRYDLFALGADIGFGPNWVAPGLAGLSGVSGPGPATGKVSYNQGPGNTVIFNPQSTPGTYKAAYFIKDQLSWDGTASEYNILAEQGSGKTFDVSGKIIARNDPGDNPMSFSYSGTEIDEVLITDGTDTVKTKYHWSGGSPSRVTHAVVWLNSREVRKTEYAYDVYGQLLTISDYVNSNPGSGAPVWGAPASAWRFSYSGYGELQHVIAPEKYRQMVNNGIDPSDPLLSTPVLQAWATAEYEYTSGKVSTLYTYGREYSYVFAYSPSAHSPGGSLNVWTHKTEVTQPDVLTVKTYYFSKSDQLMLEKVDDILTPETWYPLAQVFDSSDGSIILSAAASAITAVSEASPTLFTLAPSAGKITEYGYDANGYLAYTGLREGTGGTLNKSRELTYGGISDGGSRSIFYVDSETIYRDDASAGGVTTTYYPNSTYVGTLQVTDWIIYAPTVPTSENGSGISNSRRNFYDSRGFLTNAWDENGIVTSYQYDMARGSAMIQMVQDDGGLNLQSDYEVDDDGRRILSLGPAHDVALSSVTNLRTAEWTYYLDQEGRTVSFRGYRTTDSTPADQIVGPVTVTEPNLPPPGGSGGLYPDWRQSSTYDAIYSSGSSGSGIPSPTDTYPQSDWVRWKIGLFNEHGLLTEEWTYFDIPVPTPPATVDYGSPSTNYGKKLFGYDSNGILSVTTCAGGTTDKTIYNSMGWPIFEQIGTSAGLDDVQKNEYDANGNLIKKTLYVDPYNSGLDRITDFTYDWRDRLDETIKTVEDGFGGTWTLITKNTYDNRDLLTEETGYHTSVASGHLTSYRTADYDVLGRLYRSTVYGVYDSSGTLGFPLASNLYYDARGQVARNAPATTALFSATAYDVIGRPLTTFQAYDPSGYTPGSDPSDVSSAVVMEQQEFAWDEAGNLLSTITRLRLDSTSNSAFGPLADPNNAPEARCSFVASYPDPLGRTIATANYGADASASWTRSAAVPNRSALVLVDSTSYDAAGNATEFADVDNVSSTREYDASDRLITVVENASGSAPNRRTTHYEYTDDGWLTKLKCDNPATGQQVTEWVYGVVNGSGSDISSNRLVAQKYYPDSTGGSDCETFGYNRQQQVIRRADQNGTTRILQYDLLGRLTYDSAITVGSGVDNSVIGLATIFNRRGLISRLVSIGPPPGNATVNAVWREYNAFNQLETEYQEHSGNVNTSTSAKVQYGYEDGSTGPIRMSGMTYPDGSRVGLVYSTGPSDWINRVDSIFDFSGPTTIASMRYLGLSTQIGLKYDAASNTELTYENGGTSDAGDKYTGLNRFGQLVETIWKNSGGNVVQSSYGRNRWGGATSRRDDQAHAVSPTPVTNQDQTYSYDDLRQITLRERGDLVSGSIAPASLEQQEVFSYDETGNWLAYADNVPSPGTSLSQTRTHDEANQIASITNPSSVIQPTFDPNGNMTRMPAPANWTTGYACKWDIWNRLVEVKLSASPFTVIASYAYDAIHRRTVLTTAGPVARNFYYDQEWRAVEEQISSSPVAQYTWLPGDRWTLIRRKRTISTPLDEELFCLRDYLDPVATIDQWGSVQERFGYDAFGSVRFMTDLFAPLVSSAVDWNWLFHGEFRDLDTLLYNYGYRYYHATLGRWPSRDPLGEKGGLNLYASFSNSPDSTIDLYGLDFTFVRCFTTLSFDTTQENPHEHLQRFVTGLGISKNDPLEAVRKSRENAKVNFLNVTSILFKQFKDRQGKIGSIYKATTCCQHCCWTFDNNESDEGLFFNVGAKCDKPFGGDDSEDPSLRAFIDQINDIAVQLRALGERLLDK